MGDAICRSRSVCRSVALILGVGLAASLPVRAASPARADVAPAATFSQFRYDGLPRRGEPVAPPPGRFLNPVIAGSTSDPSIVRVGADYYLATSSFTFWPGIPIFHSRDLVGWTQIGAAVSRRDQMPLEGLAGWQGIYAPDLKWHDGRFYLTGTCVECGGSFVMTAAHAEGPWSAPAWLPFDGIDPSIFFDDDGRAYVINNGLPPGGPRWEGHRAIWLQEIDLAKLVLVGPRTLLVDGGGDAAAKPFWIEGPHLIKRNGRYILICAQGGTKENHREIAFRASGIRGPYSLRATPILTQVGLDLLRPHPVVQTGHADLVQTPAGEWWAVFLGSRPVGPHELDYTTGRETYLLPVTWREDWPEILPPGTAVPASPLRPRLADAAGTAPAAAGGRYAPDWRAAALDPHWLTIGSSARPWWQVGGGTLRITSLAPTLGGAAQPALVAVRQSDPRAVASVTVRFDPARAGGSAGLAAFADTEHFWALVVSAAGDGGREVRLISRTSKDVPESGVIAARARLGGPRDAAIRLRLAADGAALRFAYAVAGSGWHALGGARDGLTLAVSHSGEFTGTVLGPVVLSRAAD